MNIWNVAALFLPTFEQRLYISLNTWAAKNIDKRIIYEEPAYLCIFWHESRTIFCFAYCMYTKICRVVRNFFVASARFNCKRSTSLKFKGRGTSTTQLLTLFIWLIYSRPAGVFIRIVCAREHYHLSCLMWTFKYEKLPVYIWSSWTKKYSSLFHE